MTKSKKQSFDDFFGEIYADRWPSLKQALLNSHQQIVRPSFGANPITATQKLLGFPIYNEENRGVQNKLNANGLKEQYIMDPASVICAQSLELQANDEVLDMCAAPGGKALIILEQLSEGHLWANEISQARRTKLKHIIQDYVPLKFRENVSIKGKDGAQYGLQYPNTFDKILLDAPCSGERHLLKSPKELEKWTVKRTKRLAAGQYSLLCSALLAVKPGGQIVYSTCSISPFENDEVIKKLLTKKLDMVELNLPELNLPGLEKTEFGYILLPDKSAAGPIYFSRLQKRPN